MTKQLPDGPATRDIPTVHAAIASPRALQRERRALYQFATELLGCDRPQILDTDIIDSPLARHYIGDALAGHTDLVHSTLIGIDAIAAPTIGTQDLRVASRPQANILLAPAWKTIEAQLSRQEAGFGPPQVLTEADGERFTTALELLHAGVALARSVSPGLTDDLLPHIALVGIIDPQRAGRLVSASPRAVPGLVLLKSPRSSIEVAEALIHEGAHQKLFDLALTHDLLNANSDRCPPFHPPWTLPGRLWPLEQSLAACHAYVCLDRFSNNLKLGGELNIIESTHPLDPESLLPVARERSEILGRWLLEQGDHLGIDAHRLVEGLTGRRPHNSPATGDITSRVATTDYLIDPPLEVRRCGSPDRVLVGRPSRPPQLYWVSNDAAALLELLGHEPISGIIHAFADRWQIPQCDAASRLTGMLSDLSVSGLVRRHTARSDFG
jgi:hypothetical protein